MQHDQTIRRTAAMTVFGALSLLWAGTANAAHVPSITGTWAAAANQTTGSLVLVQGAGTGICKPVSGTIFGQSIEGLCCPTVGRLVFARKNGTARTSVPYQFYEAYVSRDGTVDRIGGSFAVWNASGGGLANEGVDFNFSAMK